MKETGRLLYTIVEKVIPGIILAIILGLATIALDVATLKSRQAQAEVKFSSMEKKIDDIHWYLLERGN